MRAWKFLAAATLLVASGLTAVGCGDRRGGMVQEDQEFTFDEIAAAAAAEAAESEETAE